MNGEDDIRELARLHGALTSYVDLEDRRVEASTDALLSVLPSLGARVESAADVPEALRRARAEPWRRVLPPVTVAWSGSPHRVETTLPSSLGSRSLDCELELDGGGFRSWKVDLSGAERLESREVDGVDRTRFAVPLPDDVPLGRHRLHVAAGDVRAAGWILSAPRRTLRFDESRTWGVFLPLHALHSPDGWGIGDLGELERLTRFVADLGGCEVATLPLLAAFLDEPCEPSPYSPASRLAWNEIHVDLARIPELEHDEEARSLVASDDVQRERRTLASTPHVDHRRVMALKRRVLELLSRRVTPGEGQRGEQLSRFLDARRRIRDYARFRAAGERLGLPWSEWPDRQRGGELFPDDGAVGAEQYHAYVQWIAEEQVAELAGRLEPSGAGLYLDLPLGVHPWGYDAWRERDVFAHGVSVGAPPDPFFSKGQDWGFAPLEPGASREQGHAYWSECLRHHLRHARRLRLDHVMALHRLFWVPRGLDARHGVYVLQPQEELFASLALESHRMTCEIVGENLGTVPEEIEEAMARHGLSGMYVLQFALEPSADPPVRSVPRGVVASVNTHDMPTFAGFWEGHDVEDRLSSGLLDADEARSEREARARLREGLRDFLRRERLLETDDPAAVLEAALAWLARGPARHVVASLEDLWLEPEPQNVPGTSWEKPNWRRKARLSLDEITADREVARVLERLNQSRGEASREHADQGASP